MEGKKQIGLRTGWTFKASKLKFAHGNGKEIGALVHGYPMMAFVTIVIIAVVIYHTVCVYHFTILYNAEDGSTTQLQKRRL